MKLMASVTFPSSFPGTRTRIGVVAIALAIAALATPPAFAVNKDMVQLQTQIQDLQDAVAKLQQSNDERMGVLKDLVQQSSDSVNKMSLTIDALAKLVHSEQEANGGKLDQVSAQVTAANNSVDEVKALISRLEKSLQDVQTQQQSINATLQNMAPNPAATGAIPGPQGALTPLPVDNPQNSPTATIVVPAAPQAPIVNRRGKPTAGVPFASVTAPAPVPYIPAPPTAPPAADLFHTALSDYMAAKFPLASQEFNEVIRSYPNDTFSGTAYYYLGEIDYRAGKYSAAVKDYDRVLEQFPDNAKVPVSHLHKGQALIALKQNDAGVRELRALITRFPVSPEATQARSRLNGMGVPVTPRSRP